MLFTPKPEKTTSATAQKAALPVLLALSFSHFLNDMLQSLVPAIYPVIKTAYALDYGQIGLITFTFQLTASLFQPVVGMYTDARPQPYSLVAGMAVSILGLTVLAFAGSYLVLLLGAALIGTGSSIFHPESTRMVRMASGGRHGFAQSVFQVGGHAGSAAGPLLAAFIVVPLGQPSLAWFALAGLLAAVVLLRIGNWYKAQSPKPVHSKTGDGGKPARSTAQTAFAITIVVILMMSKSAYSSSFGSYYTFYLLGRFEVSVQTSQMMLFLFLLAAPLGTLMGGYVGDIFGRRQIIWFSILGALPFTLVLPYVDLFWTGVLSVIIGLIMASAFPALLVYAMELLPGRLGLVAGIFYGLTFGLGAMFAALLGELADFTSIEFVFHLCAFVPFIGLLTWFLPDVGRRMGRA
jgi:FSR family fosmidomycin resistance protein-like MFS transporter